MFAYSFESGMKRNGWVLTLAQTWTGTLTIRNGSGSVFGGGPDRLFVGLLQRLRYHGDRF